MRVMLDSNILISALIFNSEHINKAIEAASQDDNRLLLPSYVIDEVRRVIGIKWPTRLDDFDLFLKMLDFDEVATPEEIDGADFDIRDIKDRPVLLSAIAGKADVLLTGDKDFVDVAVPGLRIAHPVQFASELGLLE